MAKRFAIAPAARIRNARATFGYAVPKIPLIRLLKTLCFFIVYFTGGSALPTEIIIGNETVFRALKKNSDQGFKYGNYTFSKYQCFEPSHISNFVDLVL